jgi:regulator of sigma E protease
MELLTSIGAMIVLLGLMILVHEWGHFVVARLFNVRVDVFSIGFGPRLWGWKRGATDYRISILPLGGYVKMAGDNPVEERSGAPDEFLSKPRWQRALIALAGPAMNLVAAVVIITVLMMTGLPQPVYESQPAVVAEVVEGSPAARAGVRPGDRVVEVSGVKDPTWGKLLLEMQLSSIFREVELVVERDGQRFPVHLSAAELRQSEFAWGGLPEDAILVGAVVEGEPAAEAGLQPGDIILAVNGTPVRHREAFVARVQAAGGEPLELTVARGEETLTLHIKPYRADPGDGGGERWLMGFRFGQRTALQSFGAGESLQRAVWFNVRMTRTILLVVGNLFRGRISIRQLEGPVRIAQEAGRAAEAGLPNFVFLMAIISLNLGILNLLPIPILDGGHLLLLAVEGTIRRDLSVKVKERFVQVGLVFLLVIFAIVMYNDVLKVATQN